MESISQLGKIDFEGQRLAEQISRIYLIAATVRPLLPFRTASVHFRIVIAQLLFGTSVTACDSISAPRVLRFLLGCRICRLTVDDASLVEDFPIQELAISFIIGFVLQSIHATFILYGVSVVALALIVVPPWPMFNRHAVTWLRPAPEGSKKTS
ncbi:uncharacterized protein BT62DRAFT_559982 [Guyanagaster necrorhizus]|uniref:Signal peptidase complex subunit 1 n=1 Tax=Guyanagaster necrorhizus TaxID=856835 RepID=A0A9P8ANL2_9AGAR|nr:uncharacterized protein BT62DRAFT_559982 [Guyanagaster necrorhizus MCA 3950]KAG7440977.1 hypothetical protein BT62DRAFT_559982 [Guyanagaster necrorhizus MCA 3950]